MGFMEAWKYVGKELEEEMIDLIKTIWQQGTMPCDWKKSIVVPLYKRREKNIMGNYKGISLLCTIYKVYAEMSRNRIKKEVKGKGMIAESQAGFRKGRSTLDNVFVLNHVMQRKKIRRGKWKNIYVFCGSEGF